VNKLSNGPASNVSRLKRWHIALPAFIIALLAIAAIVLTASRFGLLPFTTAGEITLAPTERLLPVRIDTLTTEIAINGGIAFPNKEHLTFGSYGYVSEVFVAEGEIVTEGQPLASLDPESVVSLRRAIAQAQIDYEDALGALAHAQTPTLQIAEAEAALANAELDVKNAQAALDELLKPDSQTVAKAEAALAEAELEVQNAQEALEKATPSAEDIAQAEEAVAQANVALLDSQHALDNDYIDAQAELEIAKRDLAVARLFLDSPTSADRLDEARDTLSKEALDYSNVIYKWTGVRATEDDLAMSPQKLFDALDFDAELIYSPHYPLFPDGRILDNPDTRWNELKVLGWIGLFPGGNRIEARCLDQTLIPERDSNTTNTNLEFCIERDLKNAWEALQAASDELQVAQAEYDDTIADLQHSHSQAVDSVATAQEKVDRLQIGGAEHRLIERKVTTARESLAKATEDLRDLHTLDAVEVESLRHRLTLAKENRDAAAELLETTLRPESTDIAVKSKELALAQAKRQQAAQDLQEIHNRRELQVALHKASVAAAQAKVEGETRRLEDSTLNAPWNGYIASIPVEVGQETEPFDIILTVINSGVVNVEGSVDEIDVLSLRREEPVSVTIDALPEQELEGIITNISSTSNDHQGIVTFDVDIKVNVPEGITLQEGLSAVARVTISEERGIVIPTQSVQYSEQGAFVRKEDADGNIVEQPITLGNDDGFFTIVRSGISEDDRIVMQVLSESELDVDVNFGPGGRRRGPPPEREFDD
jgi:multidrug efflux pump subunit AcrA (membrane-fusion protein)